MLVKGANGYTHTSEGKHLLMSVQWLLEISVATHTDCLVELADIYIKRRYVTQKRIGSQRKWILTNQRTGNSHCQTDMEVSREREFWHQKNVKEFMHSRPNETRKPPLQQPASKVSKSGVLKH